MNEVPIRLRRQMSDFLLDPSCLPDPFPLFDEMRGIAPVFRSQLGLWVVTAYEPGSHVFRSPSFGREQATAAMLGPFLAGASDAESRAVLTYMSAILFRDPPDHTRLRRLISRAFTPKAVALWRQKIEVIVDRLVDGLVEKGEIDFISDFAYPLPEAVACSLLGVPIEDHDRWSDWTVTLTRPAVYTRGPNREADPELAAVEATRDALVGFYEYFSELIAERRGRPQTDLLSALVADEEGDKLTAEELTGTLILLVLAGHHTTANLLGNGMLALAKHPAQHDLWIRRPELVGNAVEELLRYDGPGRSMPRIAAETVVLGDETIEAGEAVTVLLSACNRDPDQFRNPHRLDIERPITNHLGFGAGLHFCLGASLARLEASVAFTRLNQRIGRVRLLEEDLAWRPSYVRGLESLPLAVRSATSAP